MMISLLPLSRKMRKILEGKYEPTVCVSKTQVKKAFNVTHRFIEENSISTSTWLRNIITLQVLFAREENISDLFHKKR